MKRNFLRKLRKVVDGFSKTGEVSGREHSKPTLLDHSHRMSFEACIRRPRSLLVMVVDIAHVMGNDVEPNINSSRQETNCTKVAIFHERKGGQGSRVIQVGYLLDYGSQILEACH
ncbi:hypothetical protein C5167_043816 [Papaver somniferum]|uniref:Uncharacterized protein n=1 Tax=Papaver somniferum TaxID=3469 RepID=A0A4Y7L7R0_PAPSO|nr:hypothetical protein C5167_043816 [Papaver somniferum]